MTRSVRAGHLDQAELTNVTGESGLRDLDPPCVEQTPQCLLTGDPVALQDLEDLLVPLAFPHATPTARVHDAALRIRVNAGGTHVMAPSLGARAQLTGNDAQLHPPPRCAPQVGSQQFE